MSPVLTRPEAVAVFVPRRCGIEEVLARPFIELIALAPRNPIVRGLILAQTRKLPGTDCVTFEQIKEWVETTCDRKACPPNASHTPGLVGDGITITVDFSETENGRAYYSVDRSGSAEFLLDENELLALVREAIEAGAGLAGVLDQITRLIDDEAWDRCEPSLDDYGDYEYGDHNANDSDHTSAECSKTQVRDRLLAFLRGQHPELLEELE